MHKKTSNQIPKKANKKKKILKNTQKLDKDFLLNSLSAPIFVYHHIQKKFIYVNKDFADLIGCTVEDCYVKGPANFLSLIEPNDNKILRTIIRQSLFEAIKKFLDKNIFRLSYSVNFRLIVHGQLEHFIQQTTAVEWSPSGKPVLTFNMLTNVTNHQKDRKLILSLNIFDEKKQQWKNVLSEEFLRKPSLLSDRECEVMGMLLKDTTAKEISEKLNISYYTVRAHMRNIFVKTGCKSRKMLLQMAVKEGWV